MPERKGCQGTGEKASLDSAQISFGVKKPLVSGQVCNVFPASTGWVLAGPLYRWGEEATTEEQEAPSLTGAGVSIFPLSLWRQALSPDSAVMGASGARQHVGHEGPQSVRLQWGQTLSLLGFQPHRAGVISPPPLYCLPSTSFSFVSSRSFQRRQVHSI